MSAPRLLVAGPFPIGTRIVLPEDERRHVRSRRLRDGDAVTLLDGGGGRARATLVEGGGSALVESLEPARGEPARAVTVLLAAAEPSRVEWAVEKGTECGAAAFVLVVAERSQRSHAATLEARLARLRRVAAEATKQCDRTVVPTVTGPVPLAVAVAAAPRPLLVAVPGTAPLPAGAWSEASLAIGPEGGFTPGEVEALVAAGGTLVTLGVRILRLETAVAVALARLVDGPDPPGPTGPGFG